METTYRLNTRELDSNFILSLKTTYPDQNIEIKVREQDETEHLCASPANRQMLDKAILDIEQDRNIRYFETLEDAITNATPKTSG